MVNAAMAKVIGVATRVEVGVVASIVAGRATTIKEEILGYYYY